MPLTSCGFCSRGKMAAAQTENGILLSAVSRDEGTGEPRHQGGGGGGKTGYRQILALFPPAAPPPPPPPSCACGGWSCSLLLPQIPPSFLFLLWLPARKLPEVSNFWSFPSCLPLSYNAMIVDLSFIPAGHIFQHVYRCVVRLCRVGMLRGLFLECWVFGNAVTFFRSIRKRILLGDILISKHAFSWSGCNKTVSILYRRI